MCGSCKDSFALPSSTPLLLLNIRHCASANCKVIAVGVLGENILEEEMEGTEDKDWRL